jgi:hypothetical protein
LFAVRDFALVGYCYWKLYFLFGFPLSLRFSVGVSSFLFSFVVLALFLFVPLVICPTRDRARETSLFGPMSTLGPLVFLNPAWWEESEKARGKIRKITS